MIENIKPVESLTVADFEAHPVWEKFGPYLLAGVSGLSVLPATSPGPGPDH
jgi:hypothetical protein